MIKKYLIPLSLFVGVLWNVLFWMTTPGVSYPIFIIVCLAGGWFLLRAERKTPSRRNIVLMALIVVFAIFTFMRKDLFTVFTSYVVSLSLILLVAGTYEKGEWIDFNLSGYLSKGFDLWEKLILLPFKFLVKENEARSAVKPHKKGELFWQIGRGLLLAVPVLLVFIYLLSAADLVFAQWTENLIKSFNTENLPNWIARGLLVLLVAYGYIGLVLTAQKSKGSDSLQDKPKKRKRKILGFTEGVTVLVCVIILLSVFVGIQFRYLFSGALNVSATGFTYSEYARRGFGELIWVAIFSLMLVKGIPAVLKMDKPQQEKIISGLTIGLILLVLVILVSSFQRLSLYESVYGFSKLRTNSHIFIIWMGILLCSVIVSELIKKQQFFATTVLIAGIGFALTLNLLNVDSFIVSRNINQVGQDGILDTHYLVSLSEDAIPQLVKEFNSPAHSTQIHETIGSVLVCHEQKIELDEQDSSQKDWRSFNFSEWRAHRQLQMVEAALSQYHIVEHAYANFEIISPSGMRIYCHADYGFD